MLRYVRQDALATYNIVNKIEEVGAIRWISKKGMAQSEPAAKLMTVREAMRLPEPQSSGGFAPWPREKFVGWLK